MPHFEVGQVGARRHAGVGVCATRNITSAAQQLKTRVSTTSTGSIYPCETVSTVACRSLRNVSEQRCCAVQNNKLHNIAKRGPTHTATSSLIFDQFGGREFCLLQKQIVWLYNGICLDSRVCFRYGFHGPWWIWMRTGLYVPLRWLQFWPKSMAHA